MADEPVTPESDVATSEYTVELPLGESTVLLTDEDAKQRGIAKGKPKTSSSKSSRSAK